MDGNSSDIFFNGEFHSNGSKSIPSGSLIQILIDFKEATVTFFAGGKQVGEPHYDLSIKHEEYVFQVDLYRKGDTVEILNSQSTKQNEEETEKLKKQPLDTKQD